MKLPANFCIKTIKNFTVTKRGGDLLDFCHWFFTSHFWNWIMTETRFAQLSWKLGSWLNRQMQNFLQLSQMRGNWSERVQGREESWQWWWRHLLLSRPENTWSTNIWRQKPLPRCVSKIANTWRPFWCIKPGDKLRRKFSSFSLNLLIVANDNFSIIKQFLT